MEKDADRACLDGAPADDQNTEDVLGAAIRRQVEHYFSEENLPNDKFMLDQLANSMLAGHPHTITLKCLLTFPKIKKMTKSAAVLAHALASSEVLVLTANNTRIGRTTPLDLPSADLRVVQVSNLPRSSTVESVREMFSAIGTVASVEVEAGEGRGSSATVAFESVQCAIDACERLTDRDNWRNGLRVCFPNTDVAAARRALLQQQKKDETVSIDAPEAKETERITLSVAPALRSVVEKPTPEDNDGSTEPAARPRGEVCQLREGKYGFIRKARKGKKRPTSSENLFFTLDRVDGDPSLLRVGDIVEYDAFVNEDGKPNARNIVRIAKPEAEPAADTPPPPPRPRLALKTRVAGGDAATVPEGSAHGPVAKGPDGTSGFCAGWRVTTRRPFEYEKGNTPECAESEPTETMQAAAPSSNTEYL